MWRMACKKLKLLVVNTHTNTLIIRDVESLRTTVFHGNRLFYWESTGSRAEIEFNQALANGSFRAEYWATK
ncbi:hypothetical protein E2320_006668 [Naja naja]|nr:hypothetical protein E2320_006668 [Naja naja]